MKTLFTIVLACLIVLPATTAFGQKNAARQDPFQHPFANPVDDASLPRVLIIGDSISIGYTPPVRRLLDDKANVHRPTTNCRWSAFGDEHIEQWVGDSKWDVIHFNFGLWDWYGWSQDVKATPQSYAQSLDSIVSKLKKTKAKLIFAITTPPCVGPERKVKIVIGEQRAQEFNNAAIAVMKEHGVQINDLYAAIGQDRRKYQRGENDVHYTDGGRDLLAAHVAKTIAAALPKDRARKKCPTPFVRSTRRAGSRQKGSDTYFTPNAKRTAGAENHLAPNIVHIFVDDLGWQDVACYYRELHDDEPFYETPHIDRVAGKGIRFMQAYSPSPTCSPSRAAYLSGQFGVKNGVYHVKGSRVPRAWNKNPELNPYYSARLSPSQIIIPRVLKQSGYVTAHVGKWHVCGENQVPNPLQLGFDFSFGRDHRYNDPEIVDPDDKKINNKEGIFSQPKNRVADFDNPLFLPLMDDERPYDSLTDISLRWLSKVGRKDAPFFLNFCPKLVHGPVMTRDRKRLAYYCNKLGIDFPTDPGSIADPDVPGHHNPYYASMVDSVDWMVGKVMQTLESIDDPRNPGHPLIDNTYLIVSSDNGGAQRLATWKGLDGKKNFEKVTDNAPLREGKAWMYEGGVRIPLLVMGPGNKPGRVNHTTPVHLLDLFPTFMDMAGIEPDDTLELDGCNILPLLKEESTMARLADGTARDTLYFHHPADNKSFSVIRKGPWKLMKNTGPGLTQAPDLQLFRLYNEDEFAHDLGEQNNLAEKKPEITRQMLGQLTHWMQQHDARVPYLNPDSDEELPGQKNVPVVTELGSDESRIWATFDTSDGKSKVVKAFLMYSLNGGSELKDHPPRREEWIKAPVQLGENRVEAVAPPGMTHGVFCLVDENDFLVYSEPIPPVGGKWRIDSAVSLTLKDGFAYRPGLFSLIKVGHHARRKLMEKGKNPDALTQALKAARQTVKEPIEEQSYAVAIRNLRHAIRAFDGQVSEAALADLNSLPLGKW